MKLKAMKAVDTSLPAKAFVQDPKFWGEQKIDGQRILLKIDQNKVSVFSRHGEQMGIKNPGITEGLNEGFNGLWWFDGEYLDDHYYVFDIITAKDKDFKSKPYSARRKLLEQMFLLIDNPFISLVPVARTEDEKASLFRETRLNNYEGVVFKDIDSTYEPGAKGPWFKHKHFNTVDAFVIDIGREDKQSITVAVYDDEGNVVELSGVKVQPYYLKTLKLGDVVECKYLHVTENNHLYLPIFMRVRVDKTADQCYTSQLQYTTKQVLKEINDH